MGKHSGQGFTVLELLVVMTIASFLLMMAAPAVSSGIANARTRNAVAKFIGDFAWLRSQAATGKDNVTLTLAADCSWAASVASTADTSHSFTASQLRAQAAGTTCSVAGTPVVFTFTAQGFVSRSLGMTFSSAAGQTWPLQVMTSGSVALTKGAS